MGRIPDQIGLRSLEVVNLSENDISGSLLAFLSDKIHSPVDLRELNLASNRLSGEIPPTVGTKTALELLDLENNDISGRIPPELGSLSASLKYLDLSGNELESGIPTQLCGLTAILQLSLSENSLAGTIPICMFTELTQI